MWVEREAVHNGGVWGNRFMTTARQLVVKLDAPMVNDLGFSKRYVRCLQVLLSISQHVGAYDLVCTTDSVRCLILTAMIDCL
jgi:hypothetical protein